MVALGQGPGSVATVETSWTPTVPGLLPVPVLRLHDTQFQEVFDVGMADHDFINVQP